MKTCKDCKQLKNTEDFYRNNTTGYYLSYCKPCMNTRTERSRNRVKLPKSYERAREKALKHGWALPDKDSYRNAHPKPSMCEVCDKRPPTSMDHDHKTGKFRGWLCTRCNTMLGFVEAAPSVWDYLKRGH